VIANARVVNLRTGGLSLHEPRSATASAPSAVVIAVIGTASAIGMLGGVRLRRPRMSILPSPARQPLRPTGVEKFVSGTALLRYIATGGPVADLPLAPMRRA
jgi:hypothetical protein